MMWMILAIAFLLTTLISIKITIDKENELESLKYWLQYKAQDEDIEKAVEEYNRYKY